MPQEGKESVATSTLVKLKSACSSALFCWLLAYASMTATPFILDILPAPEKNIYYLVRSAYKYSGRLLQLILRDYLQ